MSACETGADGARWRFVPAWATWYLRGAAETPIGPRKDPRMEFSVLYQLPVGPQQSTQERYRETLDQISLADELGFTTVWLTEGHFQIERCSTPTPQLLNAAIAARTERIRLGTAVTLLPVHNPLRIAEEAAVLDVLSNGRVELGVGRGFYKKHFAAYGVSFDERTERLAEAVEVLRLAWADEPLTYEGRYYDYHDIPVTPKPLQGAALPIHIAAESDESVEFAAQRDLPILTAINTSRRDKLHRLTQKYRELRAELHGSPGPLTDNAMQLAVYVTEDGDRARAEAQRSILHWEAVLGVTTSASFAPLGADPSTVDYGLARTILENADLSYEEILDEQAAVGNPDEVAAQIERMARDFSYGKLMCWFNWGGLIPHEKICASMRLFMQEVAPRFTGN